MTLSFRFTIALGLIAAGIVATADIDPNAWRIIDGRLYLNYSKRIQNLWDEDVPGNIAKGRQNWRGVLAK